MTSTPLSTTNPENLSLPELEQRLSEIDAQLQTLAHYTPRGGFGQVGYRSAEHPNPDQSSSLRIDLAKETTVDEVVLVPTIIRDPVEGFRPDAFPQALRILDQDGKILAERSFTEEHLQCFAPFIIPLDGTPVSSLTVQATRLSTRSFDKKYLFQLAEVLIFNKQENVALGRPVKSSALPLDTVSAWAPHCVTDGFLPYLMNSARGTSSRAYLSPRRNPTEAPLELSIDLQKAYPLDQLNLHTVDQSDTIPQSAADGMGMPRLMLVEGANQADFSDAQPLLETRCDSAFDANPIMMWTLSGMSYRYVRFTAVEPYLYPFFDGLGPRIGFAEIELFSKGDNVAAGKIAVVPAEQRDNHRPASALTDSRNIFGEILPLRQWMEELALRHALETERPLIGAQLAKRYTQQKQNLRRMIWLAALLAAGILFTILIDRLLQLRKFAQLKERFAADLHDELGANLHTIGLLSQLGKKRSNTQSEETTRFLERIEETAQRSNIAVHHITEMQSAHTLYSNLTNDMQQAGKRILVNVKHELNIEGEALLAPLNPRTQSDLFLFYKECLINISRHAKATEATSHLKADSRQITLSVTDNGQGLSTSDMPAALKRRAKLLRANFSVTTPPEGGTCITLHVPTRRWRRR